MIGQVRKLKSLNDVKNLTRDMLLLIVKSEEYDRETKRKAILELKKRDTVYEHTD